MNLKQITLFASLTFVSPTASRRPRVPGANGRLLVFGESLLDPGNLYTVISHLFPSAPYYQGRWSNGPTFVEYLADLQCRQMENYAFAGATTNNGNITALPLRSPIQMPSTDQQIKLFNLYHLLTASGSAFKDDVAVFAAGANEIFRSIEQITSGAFDPAYLPTVISSNIKAQIASLKDQGVRRFLVFSLPPIESTPRSKFGGYNEDVANTVERANVALEKMVVELRAEDDHERDARRTFRWIQWVSLKELVAAFEHPEVLDALSVKHVNGSCLKTLKYDVDLGNDFYNFLELVTHANTIPMCENPDEYFYWDGCHYSAQVHRLIGYVLDDAVAVLERGSAWKPKRERIVKIARENELHTPIVLPKQSATTPVFSMLIAKYPVLRLAFQMFMM